MELTQEQMVRRGQIAEGFLLNDSLMGFISEMQTDLLTCIGNTQPEDHQTRNRLYYQHRGLVDLVAHLSAYRATATAILEDDAEDKGGLANPMDTD